ncbi:MAG: hypothetical protein KatS3mg002_1325 [Candidatus Woesearchaeota archaeon]|nr:MAG: hypothetical protein KatS3mg002_1325 [Candidatus Woesearchaeota archaeon]
MLGILNKTKTNYKNILEYKRVQELTKHGVVFNNIYQCDVLKIIVRLSKDISNINSLILFNHEVLLDIDLIVKDIIFNENKFIFEKKKDEEYNLNIITNVQLKFDENIEEVMNIDTTRIVIDIYSKEIYEIIKKEVVNILENY